MLSSVKHIRIGRVVVIVMVLLGLVLIADHFLRCSSRPLQRDEAIERANKRVDYFAKGFGIIDPFTLAKDQYDNEQRSWVLTYSNASCTVMIVADRCHGTDIGGTTGCGENSKK